jgi:AGZA family xanthine/uracil permease-like MFS transporter
MKISFLDKIFLLGERRSSPKAEAIAGIATYLTMAYIIFVNPHVLGVTGMDTSSLIVVTCLVTALATIMTGVFANAPIAMAPGMGLNAFFAYSLVLGNKISWQTALGIVFLSGLLFWIPMMVGLRQKIVDAIPKSLVYAIASGIGFFIAFIGLVNLGIVVRNQQTLVGAGEMNEKVLIGLAGLLVMLALEAKKVKGSIIIGILASTALAVARGHVHMPEKIFSAGYDITPVFMKLDILGALKFGMFGYIFTLMFMDLFDSMGTLVACCNQAKMADGHGKIKSIGRLLSLDAFATMMGALFGTSTTTAYVESGAGIAEGGRTGLTSVVTGLLFLLSIFLVPVISIVPAYATAPALIVVGFFMMKETVNINFAEIDEAFPAFVIIITIALSYSISTGLAFGFLSYVFMKLVRGRPREIKPVMWAIAFLSAMFFLV